MAVAQGLSTGELYDVFLSFRGPDTRVGFADFFFVFLERDGIRVFMDDEALRVGESIAREIQKAIYDSKLFVPVFSKGYASSKWCLKEIAWMADCMENFPGKKEMLPIFYDVDASDVKLKTDLYANALLEHEKTSSHETIERWRKALIKVPEVKGWNLRDFIGQGKLIERIAKDIRPRLNLRHRILPDHFIGIEEQVQHIMDALDFGSRDVRIVVIHGMGGIGKTTLASDVFNKICCQYQGYSFLSDVRESAAANGILNLQNKLIRDILRFSSSNFCDVNDAMNCIQRSLPNKDVLVVLDDVSDMDQIKKLVGMGDWVGLGSRVIITTRNLSCITNGEDIENNVTILEGKKIFIYHMREMGFDNSLQLLCRHAFGKHVPPHGYEQYTREVISFTRGVPLAIEVLGLYLRQRSPEIWEKKLNDLRKVPHTRLYEKILMSSYETLRDEAKDIFLDIAFFFNGHDKTSAFDYWDACYLFPETDVETLISYALVKIDCFNKFWMHNLLRDLGREVVRKQSKGNLGKCSRLCNEDAKRLLLKRAGTKHVKALKLDTTHAYNFTPADLSGLSGLRFLELCGGNFVGDFEDGCLSELRWLSWRDCAWDFRGTNFYLENLVVLKLSESSITESWSGWEQFKTARHLKVLKLQNLNLTTTPDLSSFLSLQRLMFRECDFLAHIDPSIGNLESLNSLEMTKVCYFFCKSTRCSGEVGQLPSSICNMKALSKLVIRRIKLNQLPEKIGELKGLKVMQITECEFLRTLPDSIGDLESLIDLDLSSDGITELPESIGKLRNLTRLNMSDNRLRRLPTTIGDLDELKVLDASYNRDLHGEIPDEFGKLRSLESLDLWYTGICGLPSSIFQLSRLESLKCVSHRGLHEPPDLPTCPTYSFSASTTVEPANYLSTELVHIDPSISNTECVNSLVEPADVSRVKSLFHPPSSNCNFKALSRLEIRNNILNQLPEDIGEWKVLKIMEITGCKFLRTLPDSIGDLESLIDLDLSSDGITELPESIGKLRNLTNLNVSHNRLRRLPTTIGDLDELNVLNASYNRDLHGEIPDEFGKLRSLEYLNLSYTGICGLPSGIVQLASLDSLILKSCNEIQELPELPTGLTKLKISFRLLKTVPNLSSLTNLENLSLLNGGNEIQELAELPKGVNKLVISSRWLKAVPNLSSLTNLEDLSLLTGDSEIQELPELPMWLTDLRISTRWLKAVPNLSSLTNLSNLSLLNGGNHDYYGHILDQLSELCYLQLSCPNPFLLSLPSGLCELSLYRSTSLSCWERLSYLGCLAKLSLHKLIALEIRLDGLESLTKLTGLEINGCEFLERVHDISKLRKLRSLGLLDCPKLVEIVGLAQPPESLYYLYIKNCDSIRGLPRLSKDFGGPGFKFIVRS